MRDILLVFLTSILFISGCSRMEEWEPEVIARVGDRKLTASEITAWEASLPQVDIPQEVRSTYIRYWVEEELLYQEAQKRGLSDDAWVARHLDEITRDLLVSRLLEIESGGIAMPTPNSVDSYFKQNSSEFTWSHLHLEVEYWRSDDRNGMERLRSNIQRGRQSGIWTGKVGALESGRISLNGPSSTVPEVWSVVSRLRVGEVSQVRRINEDFWAFKLIDRREQGEPQGIEDVRDEITMRLMEETRSNVRDDIVRKLVDEYRRSGRLYWSTQPRQAAVDGSEADSQVVEGSKP